MSKSAKQLFLGCVLFGMAGCYTTQSSNDDNSTTLDGYISKMNSVSHLKRLKEQRVLPDLEQNAPTMAADKKDKIKDVRIDMFGAYTSSDDTKLVYYLKYGWVFQVELLKCNVNRHDYGFSYAAPIRYMDQVNDGKVVSTLDKRYNQVQAANKNSGRQAARKKNFTLNDDNSVTEHLTLSKGKNIHYDVIYDFKNQTIYGQCPGSTYVQKISEFQNSNPATQAAFNEARDFAAKQKTVAFKL